MATNHSTEAHDAAVDSSTSSGASLKELAPIHTATHTRPVINPADPNFDLNLPYRTLSTAANMAEYTSAEPAGEIPAGPIDPVSGHEYELVAFAPNDPDNPKNWSKAYKWYCTMVVAFTCFVVAFASSVITADMLGVEKEFNVSEEVALVSITLFVVGFGIGEFYIQFPAIARCSSVTAFSNRRESSIETLFWTTTRRMSRTNDLQVLWSSHPSPKLSAAAKSTPPPSSSPSFSSFHAP